MTWLLPERLQLSDNRRIRVFVSSTFRDMVEERNELMTHAWPELRRFCRERQIEMVEVDLRWGIAEEQSTRKETLKLCLDEIRSCRPFFIGVLGERYGWVPGGDALTADLTEEQPWIRGQSGKSVTELEILHGVLNNSAMAGRSLFYFRDPTYAEVRGRDYLSENDAAANQQAALKALIRKTCSEEYIPLRENYPDPRSLAIMVVEDLKAAIEGQFPIEDLPDPLSREEREHEAFAEVRRGTYIGRPEYFARLDRHAAGEAGPLVLLGDSGGGKSALLANWVDQWRASHPKDFVVQHYIGGTADSADHWRLIGRLIAEIKRWTRDPDQVPRSHDDLLRDFPVWLAKAKANAELLGCRCVIVLDALNQLEDRDHARLLGWLPTHSFMGPLRLVVSTTPATPSAGDSRKAVADPLEVLTRRGWETLRVEPLTHEERRQVIAHYLARFGKTLESARIDRLAAAPAAANPLYLKIVLDELRVTGTHEQLDERLSEYLGAQDVPALLHLVLNRYQRDYERDRPGLVGETLGLIWAARRGLSETEILQLLRPADLPQLPPAIWSPFRAALEEGLVDRGGILNFAHDFLRSAVEAAFVSGRQRRDELRLRLADFFEKQPISSRNCDELPWLLAQTSSAERLRASLLEIDRFLVVFDRDKDELRQYWVDLREERAMGALYLASFEDWSRQWKGDARKVSSSANQLGFFLLGTGLYAEAEQLYRRALFIAEESYGPEHPFVATGCNNLAELLQETSRLGEAEPLLRRALAIWEKSPGSDQPNVGAALSNLALLLQATNRFADAEVVFRHALAINEECLGTEHANVAVNLNNLALLLQATNRMADAELLFRRALAIDEKNFGTAHPKVAVRLNNLAQLYKSTNRLDESEPLIRRALAINEMSYGPEHPLVATRLNNLAELLYYQKRPAEAEPLYRRSLAILDESLGPEHPNLATGLSNLAMLLRDTNRFPEAEALMRRSLAIHERSSGPEHPNVAVSLSNLAVLLYSMNRLAEAEPLMRRALVIDEKTLGPGHPLVATRLGNLSVLLQATNRVAEAEPLSRRIVEIYVKIYRTTGQAYPQLQNAMGNYGSLLEVMGYSEAQITARLRVVAADLFQ
jgi:nephrocystin-3